jgi:uncharacterized protein YrrD
MKRSMRSLIGFTIGAKNGEIGKVKEFYFDDETWTIRYLIVETGNWLFGREVLLSPMALLKPDWERKIFPTNLTMEQIKNSPPIDTEKPVSRQQELELYSYYPWGAYWGGFYSAGLQLSEFNNAIKKQQEGDPHLRSTSQVCDYDLKATDGEIGGVQDFLIDDCNWKINFMVVDKGNWLLEQKILIPPVWVKEINCATAEVLINASLKQIENSPDMI